MQNKKITYKIYGFFKLCHTCNEKHPKAVGITHQTSVLRLIKYRVFRRKYTPIDIRENQKSYEIRTISENLEWSDAYQRILEYEKQGLKVLTCSRH